MKRIAIVTIRDWNITNAKKLKRRFKNLLLVTEKEGLTYRKLRKFNPGYVFFPHWSWKIPAEIYENFKCVAFHMTDLPFGRGGSPLQNLIVRGIRRTNISAIQVVEKFDAGDIYLKKNLDFSGRAEDIFKRASRIIFSYMIPEIVRRNPIPRPQKGKAVYFKRRTPEQGNMNHLKNVRQVFDHIRMLDAPGYPPAFFETKSLKILCSDAVLSSKGLSAKIKLEVKNER